MSRLRLLNRLLATLLAASLVGVAIIGLVELIALTVDNSTVLLTVDTAALRERDWSDTPLTWVALGLTAVGLIIIALQLRVRQPEPALVARRSDSDGEGSQGGDAGGERVVVYNHDGLETYLRQQATSHADVVEATVEVGRGRTAVEVILPTGFDGDPEGVSEAVRTGIAEEVRFLGLHDTLKTVSVKATPAEVQLA